MSLLSLGLLTTLEAHAGAIVTWWGFQNCAGLTEIQDLPPALALGNDAVLYVEDGFTGTLPTAIHVAAGGTLTVEVGRCVGTLAEPTAGEATIHPQPGERAFENRGGFIRLGPGITLNGSGNLLMDNGGLLLVDGGTIELDGATLTDGLSAGHGGLAFVEGGGTLRIRESALLAGNADANGGCVAATGSTIEVDGTATMESCEAGGDGGAVYLDNSPLIWASGSQSLQVQSNEASRGGGLFATGSLSLITVETGQFIGNRALLDGAGAHIAAGAELTLGNVWINENQLTGSLPGRFGAGVFVSNAELDFRADTTLCDPGLVAGGSLDRYCAEIRGNQGAEQGGGIFAVDSPQINLERVAISANVGGAIRLENTVADITGSLVFDHSLPATAPAIDVDATTQLELAFSTVADNASAPLLVATPTGPGSTNLVANVFDSPISGAWPSVDQNVLHSSQPSPGNLLGPPNFVVGHSTSRFKVSPTSPATTSWTNATWVGPHGPPVDIDGRVRTPLDWTRGALQVHP